MKFTMARIEDLACPPGAKDRLVFDDEQKGLAVRVTSGGSKSYLVQFSFHGQKRRLPLGSVSAISLKAAREAAQAALGQVARGIDPSAERAAARAEVKRRAAENALTLGALIDDWRTLRLADKRVRYAQEAIRALRRAFAKHLDDPASELTRATVVRTLDVLSRNGSDAMASRTAAYGRACYSWAMKRGSVEVNPFENLPVATVKKRERVLTDEELIAIWRATEGQGSFNQIVRMLLLTGQRREEVACMGWTEVSSDLSTWTIPSSRAKNGAVHIVPLSSPVAGLLRATPRLGELVFPGERGPFSGFSKAKAALDARSGVTDWRLHDIRRTMATGLQRLGVRLEVTEQVLNHISGSRAGVVGIYQRHDFAQEKCSALEAWAQRVMALVAGPETTSNLISLAQARNGSEMVSATEDDTQADADALSEELSLPKADTSIEGRKKLTRQKQIGRLFQLSEKLWSEEIGPGFYSEASKEALRQFPPFLDEFTRRRRAKLNADKASFERQNRRWHAPAKEMLLQKFSAVGIHSKAQGVRYLRNNWSPSEPLPKDDRTIGGFIQAMIESGDLIISSKASAKNRKQSPR